MNDFIPVLNSVLSPSLSIMSQASLDPIPTSPMKSDLSPGWSLSSVYGILGVLFTEVSVFLIPHKPHWEASQPHDQQ